MPCSEFSNQPFSHQFVHCSFSFIALVKLIQFSLCLSYATAQLGLLTKMRNDTVLLEQKLHVGFLYSVLILAPFPIPLLATLCYERESPSRSLSLSIRPVVFLSLQGSFVLRETSLEREIRGGLCERDILVSNRPGRSQTRSRTNQMCEKKKRGKKERERRNETGRGKKAVIEDECDLLSGVLEWMCQTPQN